MNIKQLLCTLALAGASFSAAYASAEERTYDRAVTCKALSLLASRTNDSKSAAALKLINAEIEKEIAHGKTREQADADVEYARFEWHDTMSQETIDVEWVACVRVWAD